MISIASNFFSIQYVRIVLLSIINKERNDINIMNVVQRVQHYYRIVRYSWNRWMRQFGWPWGDNVWEPVQYKTCCKCVIPLLSASGLHVNVSLWNTDDNTNAFKDTSDKPLGVSKVANNFLGGLVEHAVASCAVMCPTVNSYKRWVIVARPPLLFFYRKWWLRF